MSDSENFTKASFTTMSFLRVYTFKTFEDIDYVEMWRKSFLLPQLLEK